MEPGRAGYRSGAYYPGSGYCKVGFASPAASELGSQGTISTAVSERSSAPHTPASRRLSSASKVSQEGAPPVPTLPLHTLSTCGAGDGLLLSSRSSRRSSRGIVGLGLAPSDVGTKGHALETALGPLSTDSPFSGSLYEMEPYPSGGVGLNHSLRDMAQRMEAEREEHAAERRRWEAERRLLKEEAAAAASTPRPWHGGPASKEHHFERSLCFGSPREDPFVRAPDRKAPVVPPIWAAARPKPAALELQSPTRPQGKEAPPFGWPSSARSSSSVSSSQALRRLSQLAQVEESADLWP